MSKILENSYKKKDVTKEWLQSNKFRYNRIFSDNGTDIYTYRFPVYRYGSACILECEISIILQNGKVNVNVYDYNTRNKYAPFYCVRYGEYSNILNIIDYNIQKEFDTLGIRKD